MRNRVLDLLEPVDMRLGQVVIKRVAVVMFGVNMKWQWWRLFRNQGMDRHSEADE